MGTMSGIKAGYGLWGSGVPTRTSVTGTARIGTTLTEVSLPDADIIHSMTITSTTLSDVVTIDLATLVATATTGSPTIVDSGVDFEGKAIPTADLNHSLLIESLDDGFFTTQIDDGSTFKVALGGGGSLHVWSPVATGLLGTSLILSALLVIGSVRVTIASSAA